MIWILITIESILYITILISVIYLFFFAFISQRKRGVIYKKAKKSHRIAILIPAYKEDNVIFSSVDSALNQDYASDMYDIVVISDRMKPLTNELLKEKRVKLIEVDFENSSKAKAINFGIERLPSNYYNIIVILDADNTTETNFLSKINDVYDSGIVAMQAHRLAKNLNTDTAIMDAISEEINNSIFRKGYVNASLSSSLIGSGMAFDYNLYASNMKNVKSMGEDKELEIELLKQSIYIDYLEDVLVYDEKTQSDGVFYNQRRRWIAIQLEILSQSITLIPSALAKGNIDLFNKIFSFLILPRSIILFIITVMSVVLIPYNWLFAMKWWILLVILLYSFTCATPNYLINADFYRAMRKLPRLTLLMILNLFRIKGANKKFIHTQHNSNYHENSNRSE